MHRHLSEIEAHHLPCTDQIVRYKNAVQVEQSTNNSKTHEGAVISCGSKEYQSREQ
eukprot:m.43555 g.43555  ORF g.43555 m.43555 type:complete len:56 (-) comp15060_c0_seq2:3210-3377(-)